MTPADVAKYGTAVPTAEPPPAEGAPPAQRTTVEVNGQRVVDTHGPVPTPEAIRNAQARGEPITTPPPEPAPATAQARTQADLDRESAEMRSAEARAALAGQAPSSADPIAQAIAADHAELAKAAGHSTVESPAPNATAENAVASPKAPAPATPSAEEVRPPPAGGIPIETADARQIRLSTSARETAEGYQAGQAALAADPTNEELASRVRGLRQRAEVAELDYAREFEPDRAGELLAEFARRDEANRAPHPPAAPPPRDYMAEYEANQARTEAAKPNAGASTTFTPAVRIEGKVYTGATHGDAYDAALREHGGIDPGSTAADRDMFVDGHGSPLAR
jgi:hypothetical protein